MNRVDHTFETRFAWSPAVSPQMSDFRAVPNSGDPGFGRLVCELADAELLQPSARPARVDRAVLDDAGRDREAPTEQCMPLRT